MPFPREWTDARELVEAETKQQERRLHSLEKSHEELKRELMKATSDQTLALERAIGRVQLTLVRVSVFQTISYVLIVLVLKHLLKVL